MSEISKARRASADPLASPVSGWASWLPVTIAGVLVVVTGLQLCSGALVTTFKAAMAVDDWPTTRGHNMLLFPVSEWLSGPLDLMLEHGHRLWGIVVGTVTLILAAVCWILPTKPAVRSLVAVAVPLVVLQGLVGGFRVRLDSEVVAKVHACAGPLFFAVVVAITAVATRRSCSTMAASKSAVRSAIGLMIAAYLQLVAGAQLRHLGAAVDPRTFHGLVGLHIVGALTVAVLSVVAVLATRSTASAGARRWSRGILFLVICQIILGGGTWVAKYGPPSAILPDSWRLAEPIVARSGFGVAVITGHTVLGMLLLGAAVALTIASGALSRPTESLALRENSRSEAFA